MEKHTEHLRQVFQTLQGNKLYAKLKKCSFAQQQVEYLGHVIRGDGVATDPSKIEAIVKWPVPQNVTELRSFLGLTGYYRRFIKNYGIICSPLFSSLKKDGFQWSQAQDEAFNTLKQTMTAAPVLSMPNFSKPFVLEADASGYGIGAVLMQDGRPISFMSKTIGPKAAALSTYDKEAMAIIEALKKWKHYFAASSLVIRTDQQSLKHIQEQKLTEGIQHKLLIKLLGYKYTIEYKKGRENKVADALSRVKYHLATLFSSSAIPTWITEVTDSYKDDTKCQDLLAKLTVDPKSVPNYSLTSGVLRYKHKIYIGANTTLRTKILQSMHASELGGHSGERATYQRIKLIFAWPGLKAAVTSFIKSCPVCQINKSEHCLSPGLLQPLPVPDFAWAHISMDFIEALPLSHHKDMILVVVDRFTKYAHFIAMKHPINAHTVAKAFTDHVFKYHGLPCVIVSDRDKIFTSNLWQSLFKAMGVKLHFTTSYHPQTDGQTERVNQCLENYLRNMAFLQPKKWHSWLSMAEWWYNTSFHTSLNMTPFQALYGRPPSLLSEMILPSEDSADTFAPDQQRAEIAVKIKENLTKAAARMKYFADKNRSDRSFELGDMVYIKIQPYRHTSLSLHHCLKLHSKYYGPFKVLEKVGNTSYKLLLPEKCKLHSTFHVSQLKKHIGPKAVPNPNLPLLDDNGNILVAPEAILERKLIPRVHGDISIPVVKWLIKWDNLPHEAATWEDASFIQKVFPGFTP
jgi:hypothetical protein